MEKPITTYDIGVAVVNEHVSHQLRVEQWADGSATIVAPFGSDDAYSLRIRPELMDSFLGALNG